MKKLISLCVCCGIIALMFSFGVKAESDVYENFASSYLVIDGTEEEQRQHFLDALDSFVRSMPETADGHTEIEYRHTAEKASRSSYYPEENLELCGYFSSYDGLSQSEIVLIELCGANARLDAISEYPSDDDLQNGYRHFIWNVYIMDLLDEDAARIYTINYEWASILLARYESYYEERYMYWDEELMYSNPYLDTAEELAEADAIDYICRYKTAMQTSYRYNYDLFRVNVSQDNVRDWNNDFYGRWYCQQYPEYDDPELFVKAIYDGKIMVSLSGVTGTDMYELWLTRWWYTE